MIRTPLLLVGDGPQEGTGLGRILRDLGRRIIASDLPVDLLSVGGPELPLWREWTHVSMTERSRGEDWGAGWVEMVYRNYFGDQPGVVWVIWDPGRLAAYVGLDLPVQLWSYPAIDAPNRVGGISGPAGEALQRADRVITYGRWASEMVRALRPAAVPYLPHGLGLGAFQPVDAEEEEEEWIRSQLGPHCKRRDLLIGCVATNQPRKDLGLYFGTLAELAARGRSVYGWLHTDVLVKAWSIVQLVEDCGLSKRVTVSTRPYTDRQLALLYGRCEVTIAPGLGEGFGYPIVESLAAGTPVVHGDFGGGRELIPRTEWRFPVREIRLEGIYAQQRPVFKAEDVANAVERILAWKGQLGPKVVEEYCRGAVAHLGWESLWPRWQSWIRTGL